MTKPLTIKDWRKTGFTPPKGEAMAMTSENYHRIISMRDELIHEQKDEISKLKAKVNQLQLKLNSRGLSND